MSETLFYGLSTLLVAGGAILLYACSSNQILLRHALRGPLPMLVGTGLIIAGGAVLMAAASACTACLMIMILLMIIWSLLPLIAPFCRDQHDHE
ncbi:hypothetical protein [Gluconobacter kanchanaburiensis]|uniref:Uncharacterized protein n=1 Tax=Gluconobacter kanchanaburiensis NBRC 103587 TaxID=1307948 RepID=A0A511B5B9_9PROT|nr:hypothetical protein [Gluconobacter kanchanaburiensis]MBF0861887.1 hypothetical protein [Gluconobacter kanchanaburiensis]GBR67866.1 hypothetical protein AA103587_0509 [Gluconobacter kanchanaburiensis NBRC 103587]GEK95588.1 hypothetical protein GKA01_07850 [Gluconobacter kanchanaburiensis NBRC 103587]